MVELPVHPHALMPVGHRRRQFMGTCDICGKPGSAYFCRPCDFDICKSCFATIEASHTPAPTDATASGSVAVAATEARPTAPLAPSAKTVYATSVYKVSAATPKPMARFVGDVTLPDGSPVEPGCVLQKTWKVRNDGEVAWPEGTALAFVSGDRLVPAEHTDVPVAAVAVGAEVELSVKLRAPDASGRHIAYFRLRTSGGTQFGQRLWADIRVTEAAGDWQDVSGMVSFLDELTCAPSPVSAPAVAVESVEWPKTAEEEEELLSQSYVQAMMECVAPQQVEEGVKEASSPVPEPFAVAPVVSTVPVVQVVECVPAQQFVQVAREVSPPAPASPAPAVAPHGLAPPAALMVWSPVWARELQVLADMGFTDVATLLPLLQEHVGLPVSLCPQLNDTPVAEGMQRVVMVLLGNA